MRTRIVLGTIAALAGLGAAGWAGWTWYEDGHREQPQATAPATALDLDTGQSGGVETIDVSGTVAVEAGTTPMAQRVAVLGLLNKRNGQSRDLTMKPGQAIRVGNAIVRLRACEQTAPWEQEHYTGAFVQLDVMQVDKKWRRVHSGWLYKERPALNVVIDPIYDVWVKNCAMTFPDGGPDTVAAGNGSDDDSAPVRSPRRSSAPKSPDAPAAPGAPATAIDSNAR